MERQLYKNENKTNVKRKQTNHVNANESAAVSGASQRQPLGAFPDGKPGSTFLGNALGDLCFSRMSEKLAQAHRARRPYPSDAGKERDCHARRSSARHHPEFERPF